MEIAETMHGDHGGEGISKVSMKLGSKMSFDKLKRLKNKRKLNGKNRCRIGVFGKVDEELFESLEDV